MTEAGLGLAAALFFVLIWSAVTLLLSHLSGWPSLASQFPARETPAGVTLRGQVVGMGMVRENNVTSLVVSPEGLHLSALFLFRLGRPPALVPWSQVSYVSERKLLWWRDHLLDLGGLTTVRVRDRASELIKPYLARQRGGEK